MEHVCIHVAARACVHTVTAWLLDYRAHFIHECTVIVQVFTRQFHALVALGVTDQPLEVSIIVYHVMSVCMHVANVVYVHTMRDVLYGRMLTL